MSETSEVEILDLFKRATVEIVGRSLPSLSLDSSISELGIDSISKVEIVARIEDAYDIHISDDALMEIYSVRDLVKVVNRVRGR